MRVVIPSKDRVEDCRTALTLFPNALVVVREDQVQQYRALGVELLAHPMNVGGIGPLKNWILDNVPDETLFLVDDDVYNVRSPIGHPTKSHSIRDPQMIMEFLGNAELIARGLGTPVFGFDQTGGDVRKFRPQDPLGFSGWVGAAMGIIGRGLRFDDNLRIRADIDFCLQCQRKYRTIVCDRRFSFIHRPRFTYRGGNAATRSQERNDKELAYLRAKWGECLSVKPAATTVRLVVNVDRRQA
jgi:hypothetical protein